MEDKHKLKNKDRQNGFYTLPSTEYFECSLVTHVNNMATGHSLSVVTNSCVSLPRNPKTKLAATFDERLASDEESADDRWGWSNNYNSSNWRSGESPRQSTNMRPNVKINNTEGNGSQLPEANGDVWGEREANLLASFESDDADLSSEEFFNKLQEARKIHRESLKTLEKAYNEKLQRQTNLNAHNVSKLNHSNDFKQHTSMERSTVSSDNDRGSSIGGGHSYYHINDELEHLAKSQPSWSALTPPVDNVRDMSTRKPPSGRPKHAWRKSSSIASSTRSSNTFKNEWSDITWTSDSDMESNSKSYSRDVKLGQSTNTTLSLSKQPDSPAVIVDNMWDDFTVDSYAPRSGRISQGSFRSTDSKKQNKKSEWTPHITIPKPFQMTIRDSEKEVKMSRASQEIDEEIKRKLIEEDMECQKQFKATPVPATTFIPLYEDLKEQQTERSREIRLKSKQRLKEVQKPFSFVKREEKQQSLKSKISTPQPKQSRTPKFKARAVPKAVFDRSVDERILEEEEYRKIRIKMRAEEMLRSSSLPPNMELKAKEYSDGKQRRKLMKKREKHAFLSDEHKFHPQINGTIPDYDDLYHKFQEEIRQKKSEKEPTVVEPFNLRTSHIPSKREKILAELQAEEDRRKEELRGLHLKTLKSSRTFSTSMDDVLPIKTTSSSILRKSMTDKTLQEKSESEKRQAEMERQKKLKQKQLRQSVIKKSLAHDSSQSLEATSKEKIRQFREADKEREADYKRELQEMMERIESRPLLFERESQHNAQKRAERQYIEALRSAGLDEGFLERKGGKGGIHVTKEEHSHFSESDSDKDLDILKRSNDDQHDTYELDHESAGTFSSDEDD